MTYVTKFDGRKELFQKNKIIRTCLRAGVPKHIAKKISDEIEKQIYDGITTKEIYRTILKELNKYEKRASTVYRLRESIAKMDPDVFEIFIKKLLELYRYECEHNEIISGLCIEHQIDIIANMTSQNNVLFLVECKRHENPHRFCGLGEVLKVWARLDDIRNGFAENKNKYNFNQAWIITNTKFSEHAKKYAKDKQIKLTGWRYPDSDSLENLIENKKAFPITLLSVKKDIMRKLLNNGIITIHDITEDELRRAGLEQRVINSIIKQKDSLMK